MISWAETHGAGRGQSGAWGIGGAAGKALAYGGTMALMLGCPAFAIYMCAKAAQKNAVSPLSAVAKGRSAYRVLQMNVCVKFRWINDGFVRGGWGTSAFNDPVSICMVDKMATHCPDICRWYMLTHLDGSLSNVVLFAKIAGVQGVRSVWPWPSLEAWAILGVFGALQAFLQLALPGKQHAGPVSPKGNVPIYKVQGMPIHCTAYRAIGNPRCTLL